MLWQDNLGNCTSWTTTATDFPWDKISIMDDRNIPWQSPQQYPSRPYDCAPLGTSKPKISDLSITLDPNNLIPPSLASKYQPLRESPTPPKHKKKCNKNINNTEETLFHKAPFVGSPNVQDMNEVNLCVDNNYQLDNNLSNQCYPVSPPPGSNASGIDRLLSTSATGVLSASEAPYNICRSSTTTSSSSCSNPPASSNGGGSVPCIDRAAFERYYEGSLLGDNCPPSLPTRSSNRPPVEEQGVCGGLGPLSLALALPGKLEGLLKLLAQSLHLVLAGFCSRSVKLPQSYTLVQLCLVHDKLFLSSNVVHSIQNGGKRITLCFYNVSLIYYFYRKSFDVI